MRAWEHFARAKRHGVVRENNSMQSNTTSSLTNSDLTHGLPADEVGRRLRHASDELGCNKRKLAFYLFDMDERRLYQMSGHASTVHYAESQLDMSARRTRELLQVGASLQSLRLLDDAFRNGEISWSRVVMLLPVVQRETQQGWLEYAKTATCRDLREEVSGCRPGDLPGEGSDYGLMHVGVNFQGRLTVNFQGRLTDSDRAWVEQARMMLSNDTPLSDTEFLVELSREFVLNGRRPPRETPDAPAAEELVEAPNEEQVPDETREEVLRRDKHRCRNCACHLDVEVHHIQFRRHGGPNTSQNLLTLCNTCHASVHRGLLQIHGDPNHETWFTSSSGNPIHRGGRPPRE
jgi:hypothetical protein